MYNMKTCFNFSLILFFVKNLVCMDYGSNLKTPSEVFGSFKLNIKAIINKLKQKYSNQTSSQTNQDNITYYELDYLNELNSIFIDLQVLYDNFNKKYYNAS